MTVRIVLTGDNQLNYYRQRLGWKLGERRRRIGQAWMETVEFALQNQVHLYLNTGDLFDQVLPRNPPRARVVEAFTRMKEAGIECFVISGNHDGPASAGEGASPHGVLQEAGLATVFEDVSGFGSKVVEVEGVQVSVAGMSMDRRLNPDMDPLGGLEVPGEGDFNIAMLHYGTKSIAPSYMVEAMVDPDSMRKNPHVNLWAMGHSHTPVEKKLGDSLILYPGATERYDFGEADNVTGFYYLEADGGEVEFKHVETKAQPIRQVRVDTLELAGGRPTETLLEVVSSEAMEDGLFRLVLEGEMPFEDYVKIDFVRLAREGDRRSFYFEYLDKIVPVIEGLERVASTVLRPEQELVSRGAKLVELADEEERPLWERALELARGRYEKHAMGEG
ncbi:MAG: DNA repair exonuclease, partial [Candidatus Geothermarchaeales archaeon]